MRIYAIGGLGADERIFRELRLKAELVPVKWIKVLKNEPFEEYVLRLLDGMDTEKPFMVLGVSFGGVVAQEMAKTVSPEKLILISTIVSHKELPLFYRICGSFNLLKIIPSSFFRLPKLLANFLFGTKNPLLFEIVSDTDPAFVKWALDKILTWQNSSPFESILRIHGTKDLLFSKVISEGACMIERGTHFAIVDESEEVSAIVNEELVKYHEQTNNRIRK